MLHLRRAVAGFWVAVLLFAFDARAVTIVDPFACSPPGGLESCPADLAQVGTDGSYTYDTSHWEFFFFAPTARALLFEAINPGQFNIFTSTNSEIDVVSDSIIYNTNVVKFEQGVRSFVATFKTEPQERILLLSQIAGLGSCSFRVTPIPEPSTAWLVGAGIAALCGLRRRP